MSRFHEKSEKEAVAFGAFWTTFSVIAHIAVLGLLIYFSPVRQWVFGEKETAETIVTSKELQRFLAKFLKGEHGAIARQVEELKSLTSELEDIRSRMFARFNADVLQRGADAAERGRPEDLGPIGPEWNVPLTDLSIPELYDAGRKIEESAFGIYRQVRILDLALVQQVPIRSAAEVTAMLPPTRDAVDPAVFNAVIRSKSDPAFNALKEALYTVRTELSDMIGSVQQFLDMAHGIIGDDVGGILGLPQSGMAGLTDHMGGNGESRLDDPFVDYSPPAPDAFTHNWGRGVGPITQRDEIFPRQQATVLGSVRPTAGRMLIKADGEFSPSGWMYLDTWYIIGPFDNPNREQIDHKFPPESSLQTGLDLDAVYVGQGGRSIAWQFTQSAEVCVIPHMPRDGAIWYAYTEVYADRDQERWCIFGSDDYGRVWINGDVAWSSGKTPHPWIPDRGYKKVLFRKGYNPILFKLENAWGRTGYSMCIFLQEME